MALPHYPIQYDFDVAPAYEAEGTFTRKYSCVIPGTAAHQVKVSAGDNAANVLGFTAEGPPTAGDKVAVFMSGVVWATAAAAITAMSECMSAAAGEIKAKAAVATTTYNIVGTALLAAAAQGDLVPLRVNFYRFESSI